jgi:hypothetical protein
MINKVYPNHYVFVIMILHLLTKKRNVYYHCILMILNFDMLIIIIMIGNDWVNFNYNNFIMTINHFILLTILINHSIVYKVIKFVSLVMTLFVVFIY